MSIVISSTFILLLIFFILLPLIVWHVFVFENVNGIAHNLSWYKYDGDSQHYIYWAGFWLIVVFGFGRVRFKS